MRRSQIFAVLAAGSVAFSPLVAQQPVQPQQSVQSFPKDPGTATLISVLITGGGQMYSGEVGRGLAMLGIGTGAIIVGAVASSGPSCNYDGFDASCTDGNSAPLVVGALVAVGTWVYSIVDAGNSARRYNAARGIRTALQTMEPRVRVGSNGRTNLGLSLTF